ncbi:MAG: HK97 gp10 family phage protein [Lachnospiraceae bacterium]|nr:HK97 gp10 family phage protein [Lachnospiraceae bacterium]
MITFKHKGDFSKAFAFFERLKNLFKSGILDKYGREGVDALRRATPVDTGKTADSWRYEIKNTSNGMAIEFYNDNIPPGANVSVAILLQYGHGLHGGGYVRGIDYINPAARPIFERMSEELSRKVNGT